VTVPRPTSAGGVFTEAGRSGWRWCFWINVPLTAISCLVVIFLLPLKRKKGDVIGKLKRIDYLGTLLVLAWAVLILLPISW
jgi:MFS family permease